MKNFNGKYSIKIDTENQYVVTFIPTAEMIWVSQRELAQLFGVYLQVITYNIGKIYEDEIFDNSTCQYNLYTSRNKIKYERTHFTFQIIIALAFRINSPQTKAFRDWVTTNSFERKPVDFQFSLN